MSNIVFASNNKSHWPFSNSSTLAGTFDADRVPYSLKMVHGQEITSPVFVPVTGDVSWIHFLAWADTQEYGEQPSMIKAYDINGKILFSIIKQDITNDLITTLIVYNGGGGSVSVNQTGAFSRGIANGVDIKYDLSGSAINVKFYLNGSQVATQSYGTNSNGLEQPAYLTFSSVFAKNATGSFYISEVIVADGDTRNARLHLLRPIASGGETDWFGAAGDLADDDPSSGMTSINAEERQTLQLSDYTGALNMSAVVIVSQSFAGANAPQNMRHTIRMSTVNYDSASDMLFGETLQYHLTDFQLNPATSGPWISTDLIDLEIGFISKA